MQNGHRRHSNTNGPESAALVGGQPRADTKNKLASIIDGFSSFDCEMKTGTRQRREKDEQRLSDLRNGVVRIDRALNAEIRRGVERNKAIQVWADEQLLDITNSFTTRLEERTMDAKDRLGGLEKRMEQLEDHFSKEKERILREAEERGQELRNLLRDFHEAFEAERSSRVEREGRMVAMLGEQEQDVNQRFEVERTTRETKYVELRRVLDEFVRNRTKTDEQFQGFVQEELVVLKNEIARETQSRIREDDEIVDALSRYTNKLQQSLRIISSGEA